MKLWERMLRRHDGREVGATFNGQHLVSYYTTWAEGHGHETLPTSFADYVQSGYAGNGVVFACILARLLLLSEIEFKFQRLASRDLFGDPALAPLETPWPNGSTGELVARMEQDVSLAGNFYGRRRPGGLERWRPDWVSIVTKVNETTGRREVIGYLHQEGGIGQGGEIDLAFVEDVVHWSPIPDPLSPFRGMSWLTPVAREITGDTAMSRHKNKFFDNAATPNMLVTVKERLEPDDRKRIVEQLRARHGGVENAYKTMLIDGGADVTMLGQSMEQMTFTLVQSAGENRICVASGVPAIVVGLKEGLQAATYSNYSQAMRRMGDMTARPLWRTMCPALQKAVRTPNGARLWYDASQIAALRQDAKDEAEINQLRANAIKALTEAGYEPTSVVAAVNASDMKMLKHTGVFSVQLQPPGTGNGNGKSDKARSMRVVRDQLGKIERVDLHEGVGA